MKNPVKVIFVPGNGGGTPRDNWFPYLENKLTEMGITVITKDFPDNDIGREKYWIPFLKNDLKADQNAILIGYSTGAIAAMRFAEKNKILGSILVATYYTDLGDEKEKESGYFDHPWNWEAIKKNQRWIVQFTSTDDPYIPVEEAHLVHEKLGTEYYEYTDQGHFGPDIGKTEFPEIVNIIKTKLLTTQVPFPLRLWRRGRENEKSGDTPRPGGGW